MAENKYSPPVETDVDKAYAMLKAVTASIPGCGGPLTELWIALINSPIERRRQQWMEKVAVAICKLEIDLEKLQKNDVFITTYLNATLAAVKTHQQEKLQYLLNAILNSAQGISIKDDFKSIFIRYIDEMTAAHIVVLQVLYDDREVVKNINSYDDLYVHFLNVTKEPYPEKFEFKALCSDLIARSLLQISSSVNDFSGMHQNIVLIDNEVIEGDMIKISDLGVDFLIFISRKGKR